MENYFDYSKRKVNRVNRKRIAFISRMSYLMQYFPSSSKEVNELIEWLYCLSENLKFRHFFLDISRIDYRLKPVEVLDKNRLIKHIWNNDMYLYSYAMLLHYYNYELYDDALTEIIREIFLRLEKIIYPSDGSGRDYEDVKYYVEVDYIEEQ